jgi:Raf kinase inhibitor-like YbhB/YbcL family protein
MLKGCRDGRIAVLKNLHTPSQKIAVVVVSAVFLLIACDDEKPMTFIMRSSAFGEKEAMPSDFACGEGISPPLSFSQIPSEVQSLTVVAEDLDRISGTYTHWMIWNLPKRVMLTQDIENWPVEGAVMGTADDGKTVGYLAPCPPKGEIHRIVFRAYGLDGPLDLEEGALRSEFNDAVKNHIVAEASLTAEAVGK